MSREISEWARECLFDLVGYSGRSLADYLVSLASKSTSASALFESLIENDIPRTEAAKNFCDKLYSRVHVGSSSAKPTNQGGSQSQRQLSNAQLLRQSAKYRMIESDEGESSDEIYGKSDKRVEKEKKKSKKKKRDRGEEKDARASKKKSSSRPKSKAETGDGNSSEEDTTIIRTMSEKVAEEQADEEAAKRAIMDADIVERDEFVSRLLEKETSKTKVKDRAKQSSVDPVAKAALTKAEGNQVKSNGGESAIEMLRESSRQHYLEKREEKELRLLEMTMKDDEAMFADHELTNEERLQRDVNRQVLAMAKNKYRFDVKDEAYHLPEGYEDAVSGLVDKNKREAALTARYEEEEPGERKREQESWEEQLARKARQPLHKRPGEEAHSYGHYGGDAMIGGSKFNEKYELIAENSIEFLSLEMLKGTRTEEQEQEQEESQLHNVSLTEPESDSMATTSQPLSKHQKILEVRKKLPVFAYRNEFLLAVQKHKVIIVVGETGSGKTTQLAQYLHEEGWTKLGKIGCTQPRRVAAMSVAARVAAEMDCKLGREVGYAVRFEDNTSDKTVIKYMTDGMLLREFLTEPDLASYSCMIVDEAHERTLHTDVLFGLVKDISRFRDDFRLIISSATLDADKFSEYFDDAPKFVIPGRMFNVDIMYTKAPEADYVDAAVVTTLQIHVTQDLPGDILVFFTGQDEIESCMEILTQRVRGLGSKIPELRICPVYANLPSDMQAKIFEPTPAGSRKVVLGTNIAETSLTIDGICYVIDIGFCKQKSYNPKTGMESLVVTPVSQAASNQRAGRAGRTQPGKCFRLFTAWSFYNELEPNTTPEIKRTNMGNVVLMLKSLGIDDLLNFDFMDRPPAETLMRALEQLYALGALNDRGELTKMGRRMAEFPLDPMMSKAVIASEKYGCTSEVLTVVSMLSIGSPVFYRPKEKALHADNARLNFARGGGGDHMALMRVYSEWEQTSYSVQWCYENYLQHRLLNKARDVREQLVGLCDRVEVDVSATSRDPELVCKALTAGFFYNTARLGRSGEYVTTKQAHTVFIHPSSCMSPRIPKPSEGSETKQQEESRKREEEQALLNLPKWVMFHELTFTTKEYMRHICPIKSSWLTEIAPHYYQNSDIAELVDRKKIPNKKGSLKPSAGK